MIHLPATPLPAGATPANPGPPERWPSRITAVPLAVPTGPHRGACRMTVVACDPGAYVRRLSCGVENAGNKAFPIFKPWGHIPADGSRPGFFKPNWPAVDWVWDDALCLFVEYAAPAGPTSLGGLSLALDYAR